MNRTAPSFCKLLFRNLSTKKLSSRFDFDADVDVANGLKDGSIKARRHPGMFNVKPVSLPEPLTEAVEAVLKDYSWKALSRDAQSLTTYIWSRHIPLETEEHSRKWKEIEERIKKREGIDLSRPDLPDEEKKRLQDSLRSKVHWKMKVTTYQWKAIQYKPYRCALYLAGRLAPDYAALVKIMSEMKKRDPEFAPLTMLDFGSGVGSSIWAMDHVWPGVCRETVCVDSSADMNDLADRLLRGGDPNNPRMLRPGGTFFKQFLPLSNLLKYDLVVSSRSFFELPDIATRLKILDVLWHKTSGYLVLVEAGTNAGYKLVQEARDYVLELSRRAREEGESDPEGYVFAPCPHDKFCPKFFASKVPCNFEVSYKPLSLERDQHPNKDRFAYVVLKRGRREAAAEKHWPRVLENPLIRKKHVICRLCTRFGTLRELVATKRKHTKECSRLVKYSKWGDLLPVQLSETCDSEITSGHNNDDELSEPEKCVQN